MTAETKEDSKNLTAFVSGAADYVKSKEAENPVQSESIEVPVEAAAAFADLYKKDQVIILTWDKLTDTKTVTSWGKSVFNSVNAAAAANEFKKLLNFPKSQCDTVSQKVLNLIEAAECALGTLENNAWTVAEAIEKLRAALAPDEWKQ